MPPLPSTRTRDEGSPRGIPAPDGPMENAHPLFADRSVPPTGSAPVAGTEPLAGSTLMQSIVLLVDDDDAVRQVTARYLALLGYTVVEAVDAAHAFALVTPQSRIDLVLSDIVMPGMHGPALLDELRSRRPSLRTVLMTGFAPEALHWEDWPPGADFLNKPFTIEELRVCLARQLGPETHASPCAVPASDECAQGSCCNDPASGRSQS